MGPGKKSPFKNDVATTRGERERKEHSAASVSDLWQKENVKGKMNLMGDDDDDSERSSLPVPLGEGGGGGKHRILADLSRVEQDLSFLQEELEELEQTDMVSTVCEELLRVIEARPDPLLPITNGPFNLAWDLWFEGPKGAQGCRCLIL